MNNALQQRVNLHKSSDDIAKKLLALANGNRLRILVHLSDGPSSVGEIEEAVQLSQSAISQHLAKMKKANVVSCKKDAQTHYYYIEDDRIFKFMNQIHDTFCAELIAE